MKRIFIVALLCASVNCLKAQNTYPFPSSGSVGIGTTSPQSPLHIYQSTPNATGLIIQGSTINADNIQHYIALTFDGDYGNATGNYSQIRSYSNLYSYWGSQLTFHTTQYGVANTLVERMRIDANGNVGIGTASPGSVLTIRSASTGVSIEPGSGNYFGTLAFNRESKTGTIFNSSGNAFQINNGGNDQNLHIQVYHGDGSLVTDNALVIAGTNGNIGIGTIDDSSWQLANSTYKLAVGGSMIATAVTVKLRSAWPDYVFKSTYHLTPLSEIKTYIDLNHHLPDMPSEKEVADKGLNLGEMNKLLTKKVEELTLYLIEKDKQLKEIAEKQQQQSKINQELLENLKQCKPN